MLPSLRSQYSVGLSPTRVEIVRTRHGWRTSTSPPVVLNVSPAEAAAPWQRAIAVFETWLAENSVRHGELDVIVADSFVRYANIPWSDGIDTPSEVQVLAQLKFEELFGAVSSDWDIVVDMRAYGKAGMACGIEHTFMQSLERLCEQYDCRLRTLQPNFMRLFNRIRSNVAGEAILVAVDEGHCVFACLKAREWISIRSLRATGKVEEWLPVMAEREALLQGLDHDTPIQLLAAGLTNHAWIKDYPRISMLNSADATPVQDRLKGT